MSDNMNSEPKPQFSSPNAVPGPVLNPSLQNVLPHPPVVDAIGYTQLSAGERVFADNVILGGIYSHMSRKDLKSCLVLRKDAFECATKALYSGRIEDNLAMVLTGLHCPPVS